MLVAEVQAQGVLEGPIGRAVPLVGLALIAASVIVNPPPYLDLPAAMGAGLLIASIVSRRHEEARFARPAIALGAISYSVYLWHPAIIEAVDRPTPSWGGALLALVITVAVASAVYVLGEGPAIRVGHRVVLARRRMATRRSAFPVRSVPLHPIQLAAAAYERKYWRKRQGQVEQ